MKLNLPAVPIALLLAAAVVRPVSAEESPGGESIVSYVHPVKKEGEEKVWFLTLGGLYERKQGNTDTLRSNLLAEIKYDDELSSVIASYQGFYGTAHDKKNEDRGSGILRADRFAFSRVELFAFTWSEYNLPADLTHRNNSGAGLKFVLFRNYFWKMDLSGAPVYQFEKYRTREDTRTWRWSCRYRVLATPVKYTTLSFMFFYIPRIDQVSDHRTLVDAKLSVSVTRDISCALGYIRSYNSAPFPGTSGLDTNAYAQVALKL
ncbi:MAG: DUF481 domain-containing protein [Spirochaetes bacterium]|nr:MAG: DUF481 domain-containing protein [Spirochaetota bacterium]